MHKVVCFSIPIDVDAKEDHGRLQVTYFEPVDVDVGKRKETHHCNDLLQAGPTMFATRSVKAHVEDVDWLDSIGQIQQGVGS